MRQRYKSNSSMLDLFLLLAMGFVVLFVLAFILIKPVDPKQKDIELEEHLLVKLEWADEALGDLDLWILLPNGEILSFKNKDRGLATLERDDRGSVLESMIVDGEETLIRDNVEVARIKRLEDGEYYVTVQYYTNSGCAKCEDEDFKVTVHDGQKHKDLAIFTGSVAKHGETAVLKLTVINGEIVSYEKSDRKLATVE